MIVITGASSGLGAALAQQYGDANENVVVCGRNGERLSKVVSQSGVNATGYVAQLDQPAQVEALFDSLTQTPTTIIHCAGSGLFGPLTEQTPQQLQALIDNNLMSAMLVLQQAVKRFADQSVQMVMVMSTAAQTAKCGESSYCAVKWGVRGLFESLRLELKGKPMKLIGVYPGGMKTDFWNTSGATVQTDTFMSADEAAKMIVAALQQSQHGYISDITVNRH